MGKKPYLKKWEIVIQVGILIVASVAVAFSYIALIEAINASKQANDLTAIANDLSNRSLAVAEAEQALMNRLHNVSVIALEPSTVSATLDYSTLIRKDEGSNQNYWDVTSYFSMNGNLSYDVTLLSTFFAEINFTVSMVNSAYNISFSKAPQSFILPKEEVKTVPYTSLIEVQGYIHPRTIGSWEIYPSVAKMINQTYSLNLDYLLLRVDMLDVGTNNLLKSQEFTIPLQINFNP